MLRCCIKYFFSPVHKIMLIGYYALVLHAEKGSWVGVWFSKCFKEECKGPSKTPFPKWNTFACEIQTNVLVLFQCNVFLAIELIKSNEQGVWKCTNLDIKKIFPAQFFFCMNMYRRTKKASWLAHRIHWC